MRGDLIETFQIISGISNYGRDFFSISLRTVNLLSRQISKTKSTNYLGILTYIVIYFRNKFLYQIKNCRSITKINDII